MYVVTAIASETEASEKSFVRMNFGMRTFFLSTNSDILLSIIDTCILEVSNNNDLEENKNVCIEMTTKEFFQFYYQIENIKNSLSNV